MRRVFLFITAMALASLLSCTQEVEPEQSSPQQITLTAVQEGTNPGTRTGLPYGNNVPYWFPQDELSVFSSPDVQSRFELKVKETSLVGEFVGTVPGGPAAEYVAVYPYSRDNRLERGASRTGYGAYDYCISTTIKGVQDPYYGLCFQAFPSASCFSGSEFTMYGLAGGVRFMPGKPDLLFAVFRSNGGEPVSGTLTAGISREDPVPGDIRATGGEWSDRVILANNRPGDTFAANEVLAPSLAPGTLEKGFTIYLFWKDGSVSEVSTSKPYTVKRSTFSNLTNFSEKMTEPRTMDAIDLGLSVRWGSCNLGTLDSADPGIRFAWAEQYTRNEWGAENYSCYGYGAGTEFVDRYASLSTVAYQDDMAYTTLGGNWRMPTKEEFQELVAGCNWTRKTDGGPGGKDPYWLGTSKKNGQTIILPDFPCWTSTKGYEWKDGSVKTWRAPYYGNCIRPVQVDDEFIDFADKNLEAALLELLDTNADGKLSKMEAASVTEMPFLGSNKDYTSFDEFRFFTGVTRISGFERWTKLSSIKLPPSITEISNSSFNYCESLTSIEFPSSLVRIGGFSYCSGLKEIVLPEGVQTITFSAFSNCENLTSVTFPSTLRSIEAHSFAWSRNITQMHIQGIESWLRVELQVETHPFYESREGHLFVGASEITEVVIPETITEIGDNAFLGCRYITSVKTHDGITRIGNLAMQSCYGLTSFDMPAGLVEIGDQAFGTTSFTSISIPEGTKRMGHYVFRNCWKMESVSLPSSLEYMGESVFSGCTSLVRMDIPSLESWLGGDINSHPFEASGEGHMYVAGSELTTLVVPAGFSTIHKYAFYGCPSITSVVIPEGVKSICFGAFQHCSGITSLQLPQSLETIQTWSFDFCSSLTSIVIPSGVTSIGSTFGMCNAVTYIEMQPVIPPALPAHATFPGTCPIYVPAESVSAYKSAPNWKDFSSRIQAKP